MNDGGLQKTNVSASIRFLISARHKPFGAKLIYGREEGTPPRGTDLLSRCKPLERNSDDESRRRLSASKQAGSRNQLSQSALIAESGQRPSSSN
ncbi:hypothetical protein CEXT_732481 [Caerostris extrusa]|uniref:Uncharacterized protein n=1 Tax=Caerostris extrusa TaxID=172846 RepID=A0AAV4QVR7_CAEEX|nr:hypothetical protein CEXT_732481 [Caerostris extrusa]